MGKISVIVPIYNTEKYLQRCVDSILKQTYQNLEVILVNDGSTDGSSDICEWYRKKDERVKVIHKENGGQSSARNVGLEIARGDYITFVDSDDWLVKDIYEHCIDIIKSQNCDVVDFQCVYTSGEEKYFSIKEKDEIIKVIEGKEILRDYLLRGQTDKTPFSVCTKLYKKNLFEKVRFPEGKINEDIVTNYKILMNCKRLIRTEKIGYYYFQNSSSTTRNALRKRDFNLIDASNELISLTKDEDYKDLKYLAEVKLARSYFSLLARIAFYGIDDKDLNYKKVVKDLTRKLRQSYFLLMGSPIPLNRKIMISAVCINIKLLSIPLAIYKWITGK